jgi:antitoxin Phd
MAPLTVSASEARANFSKLGEEIVRTGKPVTVFKNSKPWLVITRAEAEKSKRVVGVDELKAQALQIAAEVDREYFDVFEALAK